MKFKNTFTTPVIIDWDYYVEFYTLPKTANQEEYQKQKTLIEKWIIQATDDINGLCNGRIYAEWDTLQEESIIDQQRAAYLQKAIAKWVEFCICTGHIWANREDVVQGNIPISVRTESRNNEIESQRKDIIKLLKTGRWYTEVILDSVGGNYVRGGSCDLDEIVDILNASYLRLDGHNWPYANLNFAGFGFTNMGDIISTQPSTVGNNSVLDGFILRNCIYEVNAENIDFATYEKVGVVKIDANTMTVDKDGLIGAIIPEVQPATYDKIGSVIIDEKTMTVTDTGLLSTKQIPIVTGPNLTYDNNILDLRHNLSYIDSIKSNSDLLIDAEAGDFNFHTFGKFNFTSRTGSLLDFTLNGKTFFFVQYINLFSTAFTINLIENKTPQNGIFVIGTKNRINAPSSDRIIAIGTNNETSGSNHTVIGFDNDTNPGSANNVIIGRQSIIGNDSQAATAIGYQSVIEKNCSNSVQLGTGKCTTPYTLQFNASPIIKSNLLVKDRLGLTSTIDAYRDRIFEPGEDNFFAQEGTEFLTQVILNFNVAGTYFFEIIMNDMVVSSNTITVPPNQTTREAIIGLPGVKLSVKNRGATRFASRVSVIKSKVGAL